MRHPISIALAGLVCLAPMTGAIAQSVDNPWIVHVGAHRVDPTSDNGHLAGMKASVGSSTRPTFSIEYLFTPAWSVELLAALPFEHDVRLSGQRAVSVKQLPPVLGVNYRFLVGQPVSPFVGVGVNYTRFYDASGHNALQGANVDLDSSWGIAWHGGIDIALDPRWTLTVDARYMDIDSRVRVGGARVGTAHIDPWVYGVSAGYRF
ncbi:OmpW family protein [Xanthomonas sp. NCPPB 2632]|uniref:OmpW/AlkL family protein n=1 Tax=Xanthomonas sp. NCPPB 2632 TaxID=3240912 RepID=UPI00351904B5